MLVHSEVRLKQKLKDEKRRITAVPVICSDPKIRFPLPIISILKGVKWTRDNEDEEVDLGSVKVERKNFGNFKESYCSYGKSPIIFRRHN